MKNLLRSTTALLLTLGLGFALPKFMNPGTIDTPMSENNVPVELKADSSPTLEQSKFHAEITEIAKNEFQDKNLIISEKFVENKENFPIKTDNLQIAVKVEPKVESNNQNDNKNDDTLFATNIAKVDNASQIDEKPEDTQPATTESILKTPDTAAKDSVSVVNASYDRYAKSALNIRKGPGTSHPRIATLKSGQKVLVTKIFSNGWSYIETDGVKGYASTSYLINNPPVVSAPAKPAVVPDKKPAIQTPTPSTTAPAPTPPPTATKPQSPSTTYSAYRMIVGGKTLPYKNGGISKGQSIIDANTGSLSTWGGAETYSGTDDKNTHFIGHNPGAFDVLLTLSNGATIIVTDGSGNPTSYVVTKIFKVDDNAYNKSDGVNYYNYMVSTRGGEVITLQTCLSSIENLIIRAEKK